MNNLANKTRFQLSTDPCRKLLFIVFCCFYWSSSAQSYVESICTNVEVNAFDTAYIDSIAHANFQPVGHIDTICFTDVESPEECTWNDFYGHFDISQWWFHADNHDGDLHTEGLPYSIALEGAKHSPRNNYHRYVASLKTVAPTSGYVGFDWESYGGSFYDIDAFYFTVNDSCVQLTRSSQTSGRFVSWYVEAGDTISLEQTSNGTYNHITTAISNFQFIPEVYSIIDRTWKAVDHYADTTRCVQRISVVRPGLEDFIIPANRDGFDGAFLSCSGSLVPGEVDYPYLVGLRENHYLGQDSRNDFSATYVDVLVSKCGGNRTLNRKWTITDHCSGLSITKSQIIKQKDAGPIEIKCPQDQTFRISKCAVSVYIRKPRTWTSCTENIDVDINWVYGSGSRVYSNVAPGRYEITFTAKDGCGLETTCSMWLNLIYEGEEPVSCKGDQYFTLPPSGNLSIPVSDLVVRSTAACSGDLQFEIEGSEYLNLDCTDVGSQNYTIRYFDPASPSDYRTCSIKINLEGNGVEEVSCKGDQYLTLPSSGHLSIPVSDFVTRTTSACSGDLQFQINGSEHLSLDCSDVGSQSYTIRYFDPANPANYKTCSITIDLSSDGVEAVNCKADQYFTLPSSGQLSINVSDLVERTSSGCAGNLRFEINGSTTLHLDCGDVGAQNYVIRYFDPAYPADYTTCAININLAYDGMEEVTCKGDLQFTLPASGQLSVPVSDLVVRSTSNCLSNLQFEINGSEYLNLDCTNVGSQNYTIRYFDPAHSSAYKTCTIDITVSGSGGSITCPSEVNVDCGADLSDLDVYGVVQVYGIPVSEVVYQEDRQLNSCGVGYILRTWSIDPTCGSYQSCTQRINVEGNGGSVIIQWPNDYTVDACSGSVDLNPDDLPAGYSRPSTSTTNYCGSITYTFSDSDASSSPDCYIITRTWIAVNSCDPDWTDTHNQTLEVKDNEKPIINAPSDQRVFNNSAQCEGSYVTLGSASVTDCDPDVTVSHNSPYAGSSGANASGNYPIGETIITWTATDKCGNLSTTTTTVEVIANGDPTFTCIGELDIQLTTDSDGNIGYTLSATQLVTSANGSCDGDSYQYAFSENVNDVSVALSCSDVGLKGFDVYRFNGTSWVSCQAWTRITAPSSGCSSGASFASVSGNITTPDGLAVKYANIELEGMEDVNSDDDGNYIVENIPTGNTYVVQPIKVINIKNGISTADMVMLNKHLLNIKPITSPYQLIACDMNDNKSISVGDLSMMNKLILGNANTLEPSWKFVRSDYVFPDPTNPFMEEIPDQFEVNLQEDMGGLDFIAVKRGDPNLSANPRRLDDGPSQASTLYLHTEINYSNDGSMDVTITPPADGKLIDGMQFTLAFDPDILKLIDVSGTFGLDPNLVVNRSALAQGRLGIVFLNYDQRTSLEPLNLKFETRGGRVSDNPIVTSAGLYHPEAYMNDLVRPIELRYSEHAEKLVLSVAPNPFATTTRLMIDSDQDQTMDISIIDVSGRVVTRRNTTISQGTNIYTLERTDFENAGIYVIRLSNSTISRWTRVVLID